VGGTGGRIPILGRRRISISSADLLFDRLASLNDRIVKIKTPINKITVAISQPDAGVTTTISLIVSLMVTTSMIRHLPNHIGGSFPDFVEVAI
jgi:hypothetical protein